MANSKRRCRQSKEYFPVEDMICVNGAWFRDYRHAAAYGRNQALKQIAKKARADTKKLAEKIMTRSDWMKKAQTAFNAYIRERDRYEPCISCARHHQGQYHAGHYRTVGAHPELRFNEDNCHKQCAPCNNHLSGNIVEYRINLKSKIGEKRLEWLEGPHTSSKPSIDDIKEIEKTYKRKTKELKNYRDGKDLPF
jgi:hypothetical protein